MNVRLGVAVALLLSVTALAAQAPQSPMREGQWEITTQMQMPNLPVQMPEMKVTQCVTAEDLKDPVSALPEGPGQDSCKLTDYKVSGNTVTWKMACSAPQSMTGSAELTFTGDSYTGTMLMSSPQGEMTMKLAGRRVGDCTGTPR
jgi:hypothetical protein